MLNPEISCFENNVDPEQRASKKQAGLGLLILHSTCICSLKTVFIQASRFESWTKCSVRNILHDVK